MNECQLRKTQCAAVTDTYHRNGHNSTVFDVLQTPKVIWQKFEMRTGSDNLNEIIIVLIVGDLSVGFLLQSI